MSASSVSPTSGGHQAPSTDTTPLQRAIAALEKMKTRLDSIERAGNEPIAIVGIGCRFPGGDGVDAFWRTLDNGVDTVQEIPATRWPPEEITSKGRELRWAALLEDVAHFDARFFGISPREAESLDPQQRMLLEMTWEALEDAGERPETLVGSRTGVFIGICRNDYQFLVKDHRELNYDVYCAIGSMPATAAGRISFVFGFSGPAMAIDTACSSALVAIAEACQSLRSGDVNIAIAGGVNAILSSHPMNLGVGLQALSPDGRCKTLDARANGFVRGEGCGILVLKRLSDAEQHNDRIYGLIRGWAINQDGRSAGFTAPNVEAQQSMLRRALERARLSPADIGYVEMHGTGTALGDPIEAEAIKEVLGAPRSDGSTCVLGAVKTNIGHLEGAAGVAGVVKVLLALEHQKIPKNLHFKHLNPRISLNGTPLIVAASPVPWPRSNKPRRAGISSFGLSGTNAHIIVEEHPQRLAHEAPELSSYIFPIAVKIAASLPQFAISHADWLIKHPDYALHDLVYTASVRRTHHSCRAAIIATTRGEFIDLFNALGRNESPSGILKRDDGTRTPSKITFVFSGQGSQWFGMGKQLFAEEQVFRAAVEACDAAIQQEANFSVIEEIMRSAAPEQELEIDRIQPILFTLGIALATLWRSWGVEPDCVVGHSMGEVAAAHVAGMLTLEDAVKVICRRSRLLRRIRGKGAMAMIELSVDAAENAIADRAQDLSIAVSNGPRSTVIAGNPTTLAELLLELEAKGIFCRRVNVDVASHSPQVDALRDELLAELRDIKPTIGTIPLRSTVTCNVLQGNELTAEYWVKNLRQPVQFSVVTRDLIQNGFLTYVEMSPNPILGPAIQENLAVSRADGLIVGSTKKHTDERRAMYEALGSLYVYGHDLNWSKVYPDLGRVVSLPTYPWQKEYFWVDPPRKGKATRQAGIHPLLGMRFDSSISPNEHTWQQSLSVEAFPYLTDHRVHKEIVFPATGYLEMAISAVSTAIGSGRVILDELSLDHMLALAPDSERLFQTVLRGDDNGTHRITISSRGNDEASWICHATGRIHVEPAVQQQPQSLQAIERRCPQRIDADTHYARMANVGVHFGATFRGVRHVLVGDGEALGCISLPDAVSTSPEYSIHPAHLDACLQAAMWALGAKLDAQAMVPREFNHVEYHGQPTSQLWVHSRLRESNESLIPTLEVTILDDLGRIVLEARELRVARLDGPGKIDENPFDALLLRTEWRKRDLASRVDARRPSKRAWLILSDTLGVGHAVAKSLRAQGDICLEILPGPHYEFLSNEQHRLDTTNLEQLQQLLANGFSKSQPCTGVLHFCGLDSTSWGATTAETLVADVRNSCMTALRVTQALLTQGWRDIPRLHLFTRGVQAITREDTSISVAQAGLWGLGRTIALEQPALECSRIDLPYEIGPHEINQIVRELSANDSEDQVALRRSGRFVARITRDAVNSVPEQLLSLRPDQTYLITGGLGGLGLELARWFVHQGVRHLLLVGRSAPKAQAIEVLREIARTGANLRIARADVSQVESVSALLSTVTREMPPLAGIVHAAATLDDHTLLDLTEESFLEVMKAKVFGAFHLHSLTKDWPLDFFTIYSSAAGTLGSPGQGNYAAANTIVDALARARMVAGQTAMSIAWGAFSSVGLAAAQDNRGKRLEARGIEALTPQEGPEIFHHLIRRPRAEIAVIRFSARQWEEFYPQSASLPLLSELRAEQQNAGDLGATASFRSTFDSCEPQERFERLEKHVLACLGRIIRMEPSRIDPSATFVSLGVDSLMSLELRNLLQASLKLDIRATLLYTYPTTTKLVDFLIEQLAPTQPVPALTNSPEREDQKDAFSQQLADLGADDLLAALDEELAAAKK